MARENSKFKQIYKILANEITTGIFSHGSVLPSEKELGERFDASRVTIRSALKLLAEKGYAASQAGKGWIVGKSSAATTQTTPKTATSTATTDDKNILFLAAPNNFSSWLYQGASDVLIERGCVPRFLMHEGYEKNFLVLLEKFAKEINEASGIIMFSNNPDTKSLTTFISSIDIPLVVAGLNNHIPSIDTISFNYRQATKQTISKLAKSGRKRIAYLTFSQLANQIDSFTERLQGYQEAIRKENLEETFISTELLWALDDTSRQKCLTTLNEIDAVLCSTNIFALQFLNLALSAGLQVPEDIALIGFGNESDNSIPQGNNLQTITCIHEDWYSIGAKTANTMFCRLTGDTSEASLNLIPCKTLDGDTALL